MVQFSGQDFKSPKVIGFEKEPKTCSTPGELKVFFYESFYDAYGVWSQRIKRVFVWVPAKDDYAEDVSCVDSVNGGTRLIRKEEWPVHRTVPLWGSDRLGRMKVKPTHFYENIFICKTDLTAALVRPGDYVWSTWRPYRWSIIEYVDKCLVRTADQVVDDDIVGHDHRGVFISSSLPSWVLVYYEYPLEWNWIPAGDTVSGSSGFITNGSN